MSVTPVRSWRCGPLRFQCASASIPNRAAAAARNRIDPDWISSDTTVAASAVDTVADRDCRRSFRAAPGGCLTAGCCDEDEDLARGFVARPRSAPSPAAQRAAPGSAYTDQRRENEKGAAASRCRRLGGRAAILMVVARPETRVAGPFREIVRTCTLRGVLPVPPDRRCAFAQRPRLPLERHAIPHTVFAGSTSWHCGPLTT